MNQTLSLSRSREHALVEIDGARLKVTIETAPECSRDVFGSPVPPSVSTRYVYPGEIDGFFGSVADVVLDRFGAALRTARIKACPSHHVRYRSIGAYSGSAAALQPGAENPAAHGNVTVTETCTCGAKRESNENGRHVEQGDWH